jgi:tetratricopeptide (TPR) repeat protein
VIRFSILFVHHSPRSLEACLKINRNNNFHHRKSHIAVEYCYRYRQEHPEAHVFWIHASTTARFAVAYQRLGEELALTDVNNPNVDTIELVQKWLSNDANGPWLLVLDNADDKEMVFGSEDAEEQTGALFNHLPQSLNGSIIVTTRDRRIGQRLAPLEKPIAILPFEKEDAKQLLQKMLHENDLEEYSMALLDALGFLPMAITQAAAFIRENGISLKEYLGFLQASDNQAKNLLTKTYFDPGRYRESQNSVFQTWKISFDCIRKQKPRAADILALMALLDRQAIPKTLLYEEDESEFDFAIAMGTLKAFSLVTEEESKGTFGMHRLIQLSIQKWLELQGAIEEWQKRAIDAVYKMCRPDNSSVNNWKTLRSISPHAQVVLKFVFQSEQFQWKRAVILHRLALHELDEGNVLNANLRAQEAFTTIKKIEGDHRTNLAIAGTLAVTLSFLGKYEESERIHRQVLEETLAELGANHPDTLWSLECVAGSLAHQGKYEQAEVLQRQAIEAFTTSPELATHTSRFSCLLGLAFTLEMQCKYTEAEESIRKALDGYIKVFGDKHPVTTHTRGRLSSILMKQGKLEEAEATARGALRDYEASFGSHNSFIFSLSGQIGRILERRGKFEEAERFARQGYEGLEKLIGPEHKETMYALDALTGTLVGQHRYQEAEAALRKDSRVNEDMSGQWTLLRISRLADVLRLQGKVEEAEQLSRRALRGFESFLGYDNQETLRALTGLNQILEKQGKFVEAEPTVRQMLHHFEEKVGPEGQETVIALCHLACVLGGQGRYEESEAVSLRAFNGSKISFGPNHPHTVFSLAYLASAQVLQGKFEEVIAVCQPLLDIYQEELGPRSFTLPPLLKWVGCALYYMGRYKEAELFSQQASEGYEEQLGFDDRSTLIVFSTLACTLECQGKFKAAEVIRRRVLASQEKTLGPEHVDTACTATALAWILHSRMQYDQASFFYQRACPVLQNAFGPDYFMTVRCIEGFAALQSLSRHQRRMYSKYFPRVRRFIGFLAGSKVT